MIIPPALEPGSRVALVAPSFALAGGRAALAEQATAFWEAQGMQAIVYPHALAVSGPYAGTDEQRLADVQAALDDTDVALIHFLRGGYGLTRYLDRLDFSGIKANPKWVVGFSDVTALLLALQAQGIACIHGPMASQLVNQYAQANAADVLATLQGGLHLAWDDANAQVQPWQGLLQGQITGGNLSLLVHTVGSRYQLDCKGRFLLLEDVGEQLYHVDRMLLQLRRAGCLDGLLGVLLGDFTDMKDTTPAYGKTVADIVREHIPASVPIAAGLPIGHNERNASVPFGVELTLARTEGGWSLTPRVATLG